MNDVMIVLDWLWNNWLIVAFDDLAEKTGLPLR